MAYVPTNWQTGDVVTAEKLNKLENGVMSSGGSLIVNVALDQATMTATLDKTTADLINAVNDGLSVILKLDASMDGDLVFWNIGYLATIAVYESHACDVTFMLCQESSSEFWLFVADTENDYLTKHFNQ